MALFYYPSFDVRTRDADGNLFPMPSVELDVYNVTQSTSLGTRTADTDGIIQEDAFDEIFDGVLAFDVVEFSHASLSGSVRFTLQETEEKAFSAAVNDVSTLILDDSFTETLEPILVNLIAVDTGEPDAVPVLLGQATPGTTVKLPYKATVAQSLEVYAVPVSDTTQGLSANDLTKFPSATVNIPALTSRTYQRLFEYFADVQSNPGFDVDAYTSTIPANTLDVDGDTLEIKYSGIAAKNTNIKTIAVSFAGTNIFNSGNITDATFGDWVVTVQIVRASNTTARCSVVVSSDYVDLARTKLTTVVADLDFTTAEDLILTISADSDAGDNVAKSGTVDLVPSSIVPDTDPPTAPVLDPVTVDSDTEITLTWSASTD